MARRSSRLKTDSGNVVEEAKRKLREKVEERKRRATKKKRSKTPTRKTKKKMSESEKFMKNAEVLIDEIALEPCRLGKDSFGWRMSQDVELEESSWKMSAVANVENSVFPDTLWFLDNADTLNIRVEAEPCLFEGTDYYGWSCETILTVYVDDEELRVRLYFDLINSAELGIERIEDELTPLDEEESAEDDEEISEGNVVRYLNKKDGWGMEEEEEEETLNATTVTKNSSDSGWKSCPFSFVTSTPFVLFLISVFLLRFETGVEVLWDIITSIVSFLTEFFKFLGVFAKKNLLG